jgi:hypothetical protein
MLDAEKAAELALQRERELKARLEREAAEAAEAVEQLRQARVRSDRHKGMMMEPMMDLRSESMACLEQEEVAAVMDDCECDADEPDAATKDVDAAGGEEGKQADGDAEPAADTHADNDQLEQAGAPAEALVQVEDYTKLPHQLNANFDRLDVRHCVLSLYCGCCCYCRCRRCWWWCCTSSLFEVLWLALDLTVVARRRLLTQHHHHHQKHHHHHQRQQQQQRRRRR